MRGLLQRLLKRHGARRGGVVCYLRENGPIAYEFDLFASAPRDRADAMLSSDLSWTWRTPSRDWTELTRVSLSAFLSDLSSGDVFLVGTDNEAPPGIDTAMVREWVRRFCRIQPSPLAAAVSSAGGRQLLYVQQHASDSVNRLLEAWGLDKGSAERRSYARLGPASLESVSEHL